MDLYISPMACSLSARITVYEAGLEGRVALHNVRLPDQRLEDGSAFAAVAPQGRVPALVTDEGALLTENAAILQFLADLAPESGLAPPAGSFARSALHQWLSFIGSELHKLVFAPQFSADAPAEARRFALDKGLPPRFGHLEAVLSQGGPWLLGGDFTVADAYLLTMLNWAVHLNLDTASWPAIEAWYGRALERPAVQRAMAEEMALYKAA